MRRMAPVPRLSSGPAASCLSRADRPWRPTSSNLPDRRPQRPYYRFYYRAPEDGRGLRLLPPERNVHPVDRCDPTARFRRSIAPNGASSRRLCRLGVLSRRRDRLLGPSRPRGWWLHRPDRWVGQCEGGSGGVGDRCGSPQLPPRCCHRSGVACSCSRRGSPGWNGPLDRGVLRW